MKTQSAAMLSVGALLLAASCAPSTPLLNPEMRRKIADGQVKKMKLYVDADGTVSKRSLYVTPDAVPSWVSTFADERIGKGSNEYFELEWYAESPDLRVYEVTRTIRGKKAEVSVGENRQLRYIEREIDRSALPSGVRSAVGVLAGFKPTEFEEKKGPGIEEYQVEGMWNGRETSFTYGPDGTLLRKQLVVMTEVEMTTP